MIRRVAKISVVVVLAVGLLVGGLFAAGVLAVPDAGLDNNEWGDVTEDRVEVLTTVWVDNPNPVGIGATVDVEYDVELADVLLAEGEATDVSIESGNQTQQLSTELRQQRLPEWWAAHIGSDEQSSLAVNATVHASAGPVSGSPSTTHEDEIETDIEGAVDDGLAELEGEYTAVETGAEPGIDGVEIDPTYRVVDTDVQWGDVSEAETELLATFTVENHNPYPLPTPAFSGELDFNEIELAQWEAGELEALDAGRDTTIPPEQRRDISFVIVIDNGDVADWLSTHIGADEQSDVELTAQLIADVNGYRMTMPAHEEAVRCEYRLYTSIFVDENENELDDQGCSFTEWVVDEEALERANATLDLTEAQSEDGESVLDDLLGGNDDGSDDNGGGEGDAVDAAFDATPESGEAPLAVAFAAGESTGEIVEYVWEFGDGTVGEGAEPEHTYATPGEHEVLLRVVTATGAEATASTVIDVEA